MDFFNIQYSKIHFTLSFIEDTRMPADKVSAIRGGIGEMLLRANCVKDRQCDDCAFEGECIVRRIMYAKPLIKAKSANEGESMGYVFECENTDELFEQGDTLELSLILFGRNVVYFNQYLQALAMLGMNGIGKYKSRFVISEIKNAFGDSLLSDGNIDMRYYRIQTIEQYIDYRLKRLNTLESLEIKVSSPICMKYRGEILKEFSLEAFFESLYRRIYMLDCFVGIEPSDAPLKSDSLPYEMTESRAFSTTIKRYSNHKNQRMFLNGIRGIMKLEKKGDSFDEEAELFVKMLLAGEILHVGKNTSFGFGKYMVR